MTPAHAFENDRVLDTVQALAGNVTDEMAWVSIETDHIANRLVVHIAANRPLRDPTVLGDIEADLMGQLDPETDIEIRVRVGEDWATDWAPYSMRAVFGRRVDVEDR